MFENGHMLKILVVIAVSIFSGVTTLGHAGLKFEKSAILDKDDKNKPGKWAGRWFSKSGATLSISNIDTFFEISGTDKISNFQVHCLPHVERDSNILNCLGSGRVLNGKPFTYSSRIILNNSRELIEEWTANAWDGATNKVKKVTGKESFSKKNVTTTR